jgi:phage/plasmid primase-like uncharacterized protein
MIVKPNETTDQFKQAMNDAGITPPSVIKANGKLQRFYVKADKSGSKNGWYIFHQCSMAFGWFGCWKRDVKEFWIEVPEDCLSPFQKAEFLAEKEELETQIEAAAEKNREDCRKWSNDTWHKAPAASEDHPYLRNKGVKPYGIKTNKGSLIIPLMDISRAVHGMQFINPDGTKAFKTGTKKAGHFFEIGPCIGDTLVICEGYATGASIHEATGYYVAIAFDAGNLLSVAKVLRGLHPGKTIIIAADNDSWTNENPGVTKAREAAKDIDGHVAIPKFKAVEGKPTDFNDLHQLEGVDRVKELIESARKPLNQEGTKPNFPKFSDYYASKYVGPPPPIEWLVEPIFRRGAAYLLAGMGDIGKGYLTLDLATKVALTSGSMPAKAFGGIVKESGRAVIISCEDDAHVFHSRIAALDPQGLRHEHNDRLILIPLPNAGGTRPFVAQRGKQIETTAFYEDLKGQLIDMQELRLIVLDTLQGLFQCDFNADPAAGQFCTSVLQELATVTGACVIVCHHMRKPERGNSISTPAAARDAIRGTAAIVDGLRGAYALWPAPVKKGKEKAKELGQEWGNGVVVCGAIVKCNSAESKKETTFIRNDFGLLEDRLNEIHASSVSVLRQQLQEIFREARKDGTSFFKSGNRGVYARREELPAAFKSMGRISLQEFVQEMVKDGLIVSNQKVGISAM